MSAAYIGRQGQIQMHYFENATDGDLQRAAPAIFAGSRNTGSTSEAYQQVRTIDLVNSMRELGWRVTMAGQKFVRDSNRTDYARHMLRLRHETAAGTEFVPEAIVVNAHDGSSSWRFFTGAFRFVCSNGLVFGELVSSLRLIHRAGGVGIAGAIAAMRSQELVKAMPGNMGLVEQYKATIWTPTQVQEFAMQALEIRWLGERHRAPITANQLIEASMLEADKGGSAWGWFNHVQSHLCRDGSAAGGETIGGLEGLSATGRRTSVRPVTRIDEVTRVNIGLWAAMQRVSRIGQEANAEVVATQSAGETAPSVVAEEAPAPQPEPVVVEETGSKKKGKKK